MVGFVILGVIAWAIAVMCVLGLNSLCCIPQLGEFLSMPVCLVVGAVVGALIGLVVARVGFIAHPTVPFILWGGGGGFAGGLTVSLCSIFLN